MIASEPVPKRTDATGSSPASTGDVWEDNAGRFNWHEVDSMREQLENVHRDLLRKMVRTFVSLLMAAEVQSIQDGASKARPGAAADSLNGYRRWAWDTRLGSMRLLVPNPDGIAYFPDWAREPPRRAERAIEALLAAACLGEVSTGRVQSAIKSMGIKHMTRPKASGLAESLNAMGVKFRQRSLVNARYDYLALVARTGRHRRNGRDVRTVTVAATGIKPGGPREVVGTEVFTSDEVTAVTSLVSDLVSRGLSGVRLVVADHDPMLKAAIGDLLRGAVWQHSRALTIRAVQSAVPKPAQTLVATLVDSIYSQPNAAAVNDQYVRVVERLREQFPTAAALLAESWEDALAFTRFPPADWSLIWSSEAGEPLDSQGGIGTSRWQPNFFVLASNHEPALEHPGNGATPQQIPNGVLEAKSQALVVSPSHPRRARLVGVPGWVHNNRVTRSLASMTTGLEMALRRRLYPRDSNPEARSIRIPARVESALVIAGLAAGFAAHAINLFNYPRYELDEGTYMSSAWAILNGLVTAYPYGYGHPPFGWIQIAGWVQLTGGFFTFGDAINSGRVLMLFIALGSSYLTYVIGYRMSGRRTIGLLAMILFSFSPLSLVYQRQVLLDNIGVFWLLLSLYLIIASESRLSYITLAGLSLGLALLSKEVFLVLVPVMIYAAWRYTTKYQHRFGIIVFSYSTVALASGFILIAVLKGELFPYAWNLPWDHHPHLSMLDTLVQQVQRPQSQGKLSDAWYFWTRTDPLLILLGVVAPIVNLIIGLWNRSQLVLALAAISYWALVLRGGVVIPFYLIVLIPLIALNTALAVNTLMAPLRRLMRVELLSGLLIVGIAGGIVVNDVQRSLNAFTQRPTSAQTQSMVWIRNHVAHDAVIAINSYLYVDLRQPGGEGVGDGATYPFADVYWNIAYDPELHDGLLQNNWDRIDYIVADSEMLHDINTVGGPMSLIHEALSHSIPRAEFRANDNDAQIVISIYQVIHKLDPSSFVYGPPSPTRVLPPGQTPAGQQPAVPQPAVPQPVSQTLPRSFNVHLTVRDATRLDLSGTFNFGPGRGQVDPVSKDVTIAIGPVQAIIPAGSFVSNGTGGYQFSGVVGHLSLRVHIGRLPSGEFQVAVHESGDLRGIANPVTVRLVIGDDAISTTTVAAFH